MNNHESGTLKNANANTNKDNGKYVSRAKNIVLKTVQMFSARHTYFPIYFRFTLAIISPTLTIVQSDSAVRVVKTNYFAFSPLLSPFGLSH